MVISEPSSLVKYCEINTALKILNSQSLRWSSPHLYEDPFELDYRSDSDFTADHFLNALKKEALHKLFEEKALQSNSNKLTAAIYRWRNEQRFSSEKEANLVLKQLLLPMAQQQQKNINQHLSAWKQFACDIRICSFSDSADNLRAWQQYAENHSGIALRFRAGPNTCLNKPQKVHYSHSPHPVTSLKEQLDVAFGRSKAPSSDDFFELLLHKCTINWEEEEWRCFISERTAIESDDQLWYNAKQFDCSELEAVYFGLTTSETDKTHISKLIKNNYTDTKIYQANLQANSYTLCLNPA